jgi:hypothetical protein
MQDLFENKLQARQQQTEWVEIPNSQFIITGEAAHEKRTKDTDNSSCHGMANHKQSN